MASRSGSDGNEWLCTNLINAGRVRDAVALAKNMVELPRHPKYNTLKRGSSNYGRQRLFTALSRYELWEELADLCHTSYLEPTDDETQQVKRLRHLAAAYIRGGVPQRGRELLKPLQERLQKKTTERDQAVAKAEEKARKEKKDKK